MRRRRTIRRAVAEWLIRVPPTPQFSAEQLTFRVEAVPVTDNQREVPVYVIHWNAPQWCLETVRSFLAARHLRAVVTIIDNGGLTAEVIGQLPGVRVITTGANLGYTGAANVALAEWRETDSTSVVIACHDIELHPDALALLVNAVELPGVGIAGLAGGGSTAPVAPPIEQRLMAANTEWVSGACMVLGRACVDQVGRFDERLGSYGEDIEYCWRATDAGWAVVSVPGVVARWHGQVAADSSRLTQVNSARIVRYRRGRFAFALRLFVEVVLLARNTLRWVMPSQRATERRRVSIDIDVLRQVPLLWRTTSDHALHWPDSPSP